MKAVILAGGLGTRMREETEYRPKPLVNVGGRPLLWHIMKNYAHHGINDFVICLGYKGWMIKEYFLNYRAINTDFTLSLPADGRRELTFHDIREPAGFDVTLVDTGAATLTGGRVKRIAKHVGDRFMVTYGDGLADIDVGALIRFHESHGRLATLTTVHPTSRYGVVDVDGTGRVSGFKEKPNLETWINAGFFVFERRVLDYIDGDDTWLEQEPMTRLAEAGELMAFRHDGFFMAVDTYRDWQQANAMWDSGAPWAPWRKETQV